jgi:hypothetical protein
MHAKYLCLYRIKLNVVDETDIFKSKKELPMALKRDTEEIDLRR